MAVSTTRYLLKRGDRGCIAFSAGASTAGPRANFPSRRKRVPLLLPSSLPFLPPISYPPARSSFVERDEGQRPISNVGCRQSPNRRKLVCPTARTRQAQAEELQATKEVRDPKTLRTTAALNIHSWTDIDNRYAG